MKIVKMTLIASIFLVISCKKTENQTTTTQTDSSQVKQDSLSTGATTAGFDESTIPNATADMGEFPYFTIPEWVNDKSSYGGDRNTDFGKLEVYTGNGFQKVEGPVFSKSYTMSDPKDPGRGTWDEYKFTQAFSKHFESLGAKKIWEGKIPEEAKKALNMANNRDDYFYTFGTPQQENIVVYAVKNNGKPTYFVISTNSSYGAINVGESGELKQDIGIIKSDQIQKDLTEKGKSVLHINFDTDKATLKPDGQNAVSEIAKALNADSNLKIDINGYTDNTGNEPHNVQLSKDRAAAVLNALVSSGIAKNRMSSNGFGSKNPIADNTSEAGKAENRRVELVKK